MFFSNFGISNVIFSTGFFLGDKVHGKQIILRTITRILILIPWKKTKGANIMIT